MSELIQAIRGMNDILPIDSPRWQQLEEKVRALMAQYAYAEIRCPILESTALFKRAIGDVTDIVEKEMYTFADRNGDSLTLRPEATAQVVRASLEHSLLYGQTPRLWYMGPMFRHERPQKGRYRQFYQIGAEALGMPGPHIDAEMIAMTARLWRDLGLMDSMTLQLNSLGTAEARAAYREKLVIYFKANENALDEDSQKRLVTNPLRILDSKNPKMASLIEGAPRLLDHLDEESAQHFEQLQTLLTELEIPFTINTHLVRGLDYYSRTVFEWVTTELGAQGTVCGGGRYDGLVSQIGKGKDQVPAIGFSIGMERLLILLEAKEKKIPSTVDVFCIVLGEEAQAKSITLAEQWRTQWPECKLWVHCTGGSMKSQFKRADKSGAQVALILGDDELASGKISIKFLREAKEQRQVSLDTLMENLQEELSNGHS